MSVKASSSFAAFLEKNVPIEVTRESRVNATLPASTVTTEVTVDTAAPMLETDSAEVNHEISKEQISQIPITASQGRNFQTLYTLIPGAAAVQEQNSIGGNPARAFSANFNGVSYNTNTTRIDGAVNDYGWLPYLLAYLPPADSIQSRQHGYKLLQCRTRRSRRRLDRHHDKGWYKPVPRQCVGVLPGIQHQRPGLYGNPGVPHLPHKPSWVGFPRTSSMSSEPTSAGPSISQRFTMARASCSSLKTLSVRPAAL